MIQDIQPHNLRNEFRPDAIVQNEDRVVIYQDGAFLLDVERDHHTIGFPKAAELKGPCRDHLIYLFALDDESFFFLRNDPDVSVTDILTDPEEYHFFTMNDIRKWNLEPKMYVFAAFTAYHLAEWYEANRYCGHCASPMQYDVAERAMICPHCGKKVYPRMNPAVIIGVTNGDKIVITRYQKGYANNALVAGFTEIGETLEETVAREVMEEVGLKIKNIRYYKSQPWGIAADILMGFFCDVDGDDEITMDAAELKYAEWVKREDIVLQPTDYSLTNEMMKVFKNGEIRSRAF